MWIEEQSSMWTARLIFMLLSLFLIPLPGVSLVTRHSRQTQDNSNILNRLSNLEALLNVERSRTDAERLRTDSIQKELSESKSRLNTLLSSMATCRPAYDDEFIKNYIAEIMTNTLKNIQDGLITEKNNRLQHDTMLLDIKDIVGLTQQKTNQHDNMLLQIMDIVGVTQQKTNQMEDRIRVLEQICVTTPKTGSITTPSPMPRIHHNVQFSGQPLNQNDTRIAKDCWHLNELEYSRYGVYRVDITQDNPVLLYCYPLNAFMYVQRRKSVTGFNKSWEEYKYGFGNSNSDYWIGNEILWQAINSSTHETTYLRIHYFNPGQSVFLHNVQLSNEREGYQLHYSRITSKGGFPRDQIPVNGSTFMTSDRESRGGNCTDVTGGWWYQGGSGCATTPYNPNSRLYKKVNIVLRYRNNNYY